MKTAMGYCCSRGMRLVEFLTKAEYDDVIRQPIGDQIHLCFCFFIQIQHFCPAKNVLERGWWIHVGHTYDNGDMTDTWCHSQVPVPPGLIPDSLYSTPNSDPRHVLSLTKMGIQLSFLSAELNAFMCVVD
jgi:hypothetical protein